MHLPTHRAILPLSLVRFKHQGVSSDNPNGNKTQPLLVDKDGTVTPCDIDNGDNAWMLTASALVLMMTPGGLAIFYSGLSRQKNAVNTLHMVFITTGIIGVQWVLFGYSLAFGPDAMGNGFIGTFDWVGLNNVLHDVPSDVYGGLSWSNNSTSNVYGFPDDVRDHYASVDSSNFS